MFKPKPNHFKAIIALLQELHNKYPNQSVCTHLSTVLSDYGNYWGLADKEFEFALKKYATELELYSFTQDKDLDRIIEEGKNLDKINLYDDDTEEDDLWQ